MMVSLALFLLCANPTAGRPVVPNWTPRERAMVIAGSTLLGVGTATFGMGVAWHALSSRAAERYDRSVYQRGPTGYATITWADTKPDFELAHRLRPRAAAAYAITVLAIPVGAVLLATAIRHRKYRRKQRQVPLATSGAAPW